MANKYRSNKIKQEHTIIEDIYPLLLEMSNLKVVHSIIPGRINRRSSTGGIEPYIRLKYNTPSGIKLIAKTSSSVQEVFVVTGNSEKTIRLLRKLPFIK